MSLKDSALRLKLGLMCALAVATSVSLLCFMWNDPIGQTMAEDGGWPLQAVLVAIAMIGFGLMFYLATPARKPPVNLPKSDDKKNRNGT